MMLQDKLARQQEEHEQNKELLGLLSLGVPLSTMNCLLCRRR